VTDALSAAVATDVLSAAVATDVLSAAVATDATGTAPVRIVGLVGSPGSGSRTLLTTCRLGDKLTAWAASLGLPAVVRVIDLRLVASALFDLDDAEANALVEIATSADLVIASSPTYKAGYTGLLKGFLDRLPGGGLRGSVAVPLMTGGSAAHSLAPDVHLRPVLLALGAMTPTRSIYLSGDEQQTTDFVLDAWLVDQGDVLARVLLPRASDRVDQLSRRS
jgi:FMN reductase